MLKIQNCNLSQNSILNKNRFIHVSSLLTACARFAQIENEITLYRNVLINCSTSN